MRYKTLSIKISFLKNSTNFLQWLPGSLENLELLYPDKELTTIDFPELSSDEEELPTPQLGGNFRPLACDNEEPTTSQATSSQPSWADLHPELAAKSSGDPTKDNAVVKAYKEDLAIRERASKRKAEEVTEDSLKVLKRQSFFITIKT